MKDGVDSKSWSRRQQSVPEAIVNCEILTTWWSFAAVFCSSHGCWLNCLQISGRRLLSAVRQFNCMAVGCSVQVWVPTVPQVFWENKDVVLHITVRKLNSMTVFANQKSVTDTMRPVEEGDVVSMIIVITPWLRERLQWNEDLVAASLVSVKCKRRRTQLKAILLKIRPLPFEVRLERCGRMFGCLDGLTTWPSFIVNFGFYHRTVC